jgi:hypothetical protein
MKLVELEASFVRRVMEHCARGPSDTCNIVHDGPVDHETWPEASFADADGVFFLCPKCFLANHGDVGTHSVMCWRPRVPADVAPKPGRWEFQGTGLHDLTLVAGSSSILLTGPGCGAHFFIRNGAIEGLT